MFPIENLISFGMPGPLELMVILLIVLLIVGPKKLPELMKAVGKSLTSFKKGMKEEDSEGSPESKRDGE